MSIGLLISFILIGLVVLVYTYFVGKEMGYKEGYERGYKHGKLVGNLSAFLEGRGKEGE